VESFSYTAVPPLVEDVGCEDRREAGSFARNRATYRQHHLTVHREALMA
jgi:hypothetical protein